MAKPTLSNEETVKAIDLLIKKHNDDMKAYIEAQMKEVKQSVASGLIESATMVGSAVEQIRQSSSSSKASRAKTTAGTQPVANLPENTVSFWRLHLDNPAVRKALLTNDYVVNLLKKDYKVEVFDTLTPNQVAKVASKLWDHMFANKGNLAGIDLDGNPIEFSVTALNAMRETYIERAKTVADAAAAPTADDVATAPVDLPADEPAAEAAAPVKPAKPAAKGGKAANAAAPPAGAAAADKPAAKPAGAAVRKPAGVRAAKPAAGK